MGKKLVTSGNKSPFPHRLLRSLAQVVMLSPPVFLAVKLVSALDELIQLTNLQKKQSEGIYAGLVS